MLSSIIDLPLMKVLVRKSFLTKNQNDHDSFERGVLHAARMALHKPIEFSVLLESGANFSGLPLNALSTKQVNVCLPLSTVQFWSCISPLATCIEHKLLRRMAALVKLKDHTTAKGIYRYTIIPEGMGSLADTPDEFKSHNIIELSDGHLVAYPNNRIRFLDASLTDPAMPIDHYRVNTDELLINEDGIQNDGQWFY